MARATRSQPQPSQSQPRQRANRAANGRSQPVDNGYDDDKDDEVDAGDYEDGMDVDGDGDQHAQKELDRKAGDLARLALFAESRRVALKRDEISKKGPCCPRIFIHSISFLCTQSWDLARDNSISS